MELRDRVAQKLFSLYGGHLGYADAAWESVEQQSWREDADAVIAELVAPTKPEKPEYEDINAIHDQAHTWAEQGWDADYHQGGICTACDLYSECEMCNTDALTGLDCLREQAHSRNHDKKQDYKEAVFRWEAQMAYWRQLTGKADDE